MLSLQHALESPLTETDWFTSDHVIVFPTAQESFLIFVLQYKSKCLVPWVLRKVVKEVRGKWPSTYLLHGAESFLRS